VAGGQVTGGEWALVVRYVEYLDHHGAPIPEGEQEVLHSESEPHAERAVFVDKGTLAGAARGGQLVAATDGTLTGLESILLSIDSGSLSLAGTTGDGSSRAAGLDNRDSSSGSLTLTF